MLYDAERGDFTIALTGDCMLTRRLSVFGEERFQALVNILRETDATIDAGADIFVGHGSHFPLGIEIYKGKPVFYSLGNFIFQNETVGFFPADAYERFDLDSKATPADFLDARTDGGRKGHPSDPQYWENIVAVCDFKGRKLSEVKLSPIDRGYGRPRAQRGRPILAAGEVGVRVLKRARRLCQAYGTELDLKDGAGLVVLAEKLTAQR